MKEQLEKLRQAALREIAESSDLTALENARVKFRSLPKESSSGFPKKIGFFPLSRSPLLFLPSRVKVAYIRFSVPEKFPTAGFPSPSNGK